MSLTIVAVLALTALVAAANGANDSAKGVATLAGCGGTSYRAALAWGIVSTAVGGALALTLASSISTLFTKGIVAAPASSAFAFGALAGTLGWVSCATVARLPVSTTHAIVGSLLGAGLVLAPSAIAWGSVASKVALPLLLSVGVSYVASGLIGRVGRRTPRCICVDVGVAAPAPAALTSGEGAGALAFTGANPGPVTVAVSAGDRCPIHAPAGRRRLRLRLVQAHWLTSGAIGFSRGLNDTPKIWAIGASSLVPATLGRNGLLMVVVGAMAAGGAVAGLRVGRQLGDNVISMGDREGFGANLTTGALVGIGANLGLPMSTTHVATGSIAGIAGRETARLNRRTLRNFLVAWTVTPLVAGSLAALVAILTR